MSDKNIRTPGEWLDDELTEQESEDILSLTNSLGEIKELTKTDDIAIFDQLAPYMNSFMHLWYKLNKERLQLHTTVDGIEDAQGNGFDIVAYTVDFIGFIIMGDTLTNTIDIRVSDEIVTPIDKVTKMFFQNKIPFDKPKKIISGDKAIIQQEDGKKAKVKIAPIVTVSLLDPPPGVEFSRDIEPFDNAVFNSVCTLQDSGNNRFTGHDIYRQMTGNPNAVATAEKLKMIDISWKKLTSVSIKIDTGNMGDAYNFVRWIRNRRIIEGVDDTIIIKNQHGLFSTTIYMINEEPILKTYAAYMGQIRRYPAKLLNTPVNKTPELIILQTALLEHIQAIPDISRHILYDTLFSKINLAAKNPAAERKKKAKLRGYIHKILDYWKECGLNNKNFGGWHEEKKNNAVYCIVIDKPQKQLPEALPEETPP